MERIELSELPITPPWQLVTPAVRLNLTKLSKEGTNELVFQQYFGDFIESFHDYEKIYTDGSKSDDSVGVASVTGKDFNKVFKARLPSCSSIFSAELKALQLALKMVYQSKREKFLILSDSLSSLMAIQERKLDHPYLVDFFEQLSYLCKEDKDIVLAWVPSHVNIRGNEAADKAAKEALTEELPEHLKTKFSDLRAGALSYIKGEWQAEWDKKVGNKLHRIQPDRSATLPRSCRNRKEESVLSRLHIGHTYTTHLFLLKRDKEAPMCVGCDEPWTVEHILFGCWDFYETRRKHCSVENFKVLFRDVPPDKIFDFLKEIGLFYKI